jgi:hypothetical protein
VNAKTLKKKEKRKNGDIQVGGVAGLEFYKVETLKRQFQA